jgi:hypothetical protein
MQQSHAEIALEPHGPIAPIFSIHTWNQDEGHDRDLEPLLGGREVIGITRPERLGTGRWGVQRRWVTNAIAQIDASGVKGPLHLMGWCAGAKLAFAVATELRRQGREVAWIGVIDVIGEWPGRLSRLGVLRQLWAQDPSPIYRRARLKKVCVSRHKYALCALAAVPLRPFRFTEFVRTRPQSKIFRYLDPAMREIWQLAWSYRLQVIDVPLAIYACPQTTQREGFGDELLRWKPFAGAGIQSHPIEGNHFTLFEPENIEGLAGAIITSIRDFSPSGSEVAAR